MVSTFDRGWYSSDAHGSPDPKWPHYLQVIPLSLTKFDIEWVLKLLCLIIFMVYTRGQFRPSVIVIGCVCGSVCQCVSVCVNHELVRTVTHPLFKPGSPNLDQRCKTPWFRSLSFCEMIDRDLQGQIELESQILPNFELVRTITHKPFKLESPNLDRKCILALLRSLLILDLIGFYLHFHF